MSKTANQKEVLERLNRIKKNRFFTRMFMFLGASAVTLINDGSQNKAGAMPSLNHVGKNITLTSSLISLNREQEIDKRVDWFFDAAVDSLHAQFKELTETKNVARKNKIIEQKFFNDLSLKGGKGGREYYCLAATMSNYARLSRLTDDLDGILPDLNDGVSWTKASCAGFIDYMKNKSKSEFGNKFFIKSRNLNKEIDSVGKGSIFLVESTENTSSGYHAITYIGKDEKGTPQFMSYNKDIIAPLSHWGKSGNVKGYAVDIPGMVKTNWLRKTENCNKMEFLSMLYNGRNNPLLPELPELSLDQEKLLAKTFDASSLFVKTKTPTVWSPAAAPQLLAQKSKNKKQFNPSTLLAKNKVVLKRKFSLAARWVKKQSLKAPKKLEAFMDERRLRPKPGSTFDATPMFANYKYQTSRG